MSMLSLNFDSSLNVGEKWHHLTQPLGCLKDKTVVILCFSYSEQIPKIPF